MGRQGDVREEDEGDHPIDQVTIVTDGKVKQHWPKVSVKGHVAEVVAAVSALAAA